jgi:hypothetical protein
MPAMLFGALIVLALVVVGAVWLYATGARREASPSPSEVVDHDEQDDVAEATAVVLLPGNVWNACDFDGHDEDWGRFTSAPVRGFAGVPSGRHRVMTTCLSGVARLDFVLYPGDVFARRLDPDAARWGPCEDADASPGLPESLIVHRTVLGVARAMRGDAVVVPDVAVRRTCASLAGLFARAVAAGEKAKEDEEALLREASALGDGLVGVPLTRGQLGVLTRAVVAAAADGGTGTLIARLGLAALPGDPRLVALLARGT